MQGRMTVYKRMLQLNHLDKDELVNLVLDLEEKLDIHKRYTSLCKSRMFHQQQVDKMTSNLPAISEKVDQGSPVKLPPLNLRD